MSKRAMMIRSGIRQPRAWVCKLMELIGCIRGQCE